MKLNRVLVGVFYFTSIACLAQDLALSGDNLEWSEGQVTLTNKKTLTGVLRYNSKIGLLSFQSEAESKTLTPRTVASFEYFDAVRNTQRRFYSLEVEDSKGIKRPQFFEVLKELKTFALIASENPTQLKQQTNFDPYFGMSTTTTTASQIEILYLIDSKGNINPYLVITNEEIPRTFTQNDTKTKTRTKVVGEEYLKALTGRYYTELKKYAKEFKLDFGDKADFIRILDHYEQLVVQK